MEEPWGDTVMHNMVERPAIERVGPMGEDNGPTQSPQGELGELQVN
jgi:hypothetical protein